MVGFPANSGRRCPASSGGPRSNGRAGSPGRLPSPRSETGKRWAQSVRVRRTLHVSGVVLALGIVAMSHTNFVSALDTQPQYIGYQNVKEYVDTLNRGLARLRKRHPEGFTIGEGRVPLKVLGFLVNLIGRQSQFLPAFGIDSAQVVKSRDAQYFITRGGVVVKNKKWSNPE